MKRKSVLAVTLVSLFACSLSAQERNTIVPVERFESLHAMIKPQPGESPWREIQWLTDMSEARRRAAAEDKPLIIYTAADGNPVGRM